MPFQAKNYEFFTLTHTAEGRCTPNGAAAFYYEYTLKDHLGNARISFRANGATLTPLQENHYYAFGMEMEGSWLAQVGTENPYKYNGKELCPTPHFPVPLQRRDSNLGFQSLMVFD